MSNNTNSLIPYQPQGWYQTAISNVHELSRRSFFKLYGRYIGLRSDVPCVLTIGLMRSGSSLLTQLICANENGNSQIAGYGESHLAIRTRSDFLAIAGKVAWVLKKQSPRRNFTQATFFDKSLHPYQIRPKQYHLLNTKSVRLILLVRSPHPTIHSLVNSFNYPLETAIDYYRKQLTAICNIAHLAQHFQHKPMLITYDDLTWKAEQTLERLTHFLSLSQPLTDRYKTDLIVKTSHKGIDNSNNILAGKIIRPVPDCKQLDLPAEVSQELEMLYMTTLKAIAPTDLIPSTIVHKLLAERVAVLKKGGMSCSLR